MGQINQGEYALERMEKSFANMVNDTSKVKIDGKAASKSQLEVNEEYVQKGKICFNLNPGSHIVSCINN